VGVFAVLVLGTACASSIDSNNADIGNGQPEMKAAAADGGTADAASSTTLSTQGDACTPKTCKELGKGKQDDGCGKTIDCSATCTDAKDPNGTKETASDLGVFTDSPATSRVIADLTLADGEEDWFKFRMEEKRFWTWFSSPQIDASVTASAEVTVFLVCDAQPDASKCTNATDRSDQTIGKGCAATGKVSLSTVCGGAENTTGTAYVRVRKTTSDSQCSAYTLSVSVQ
jgi:hypothetical protein